MLQSSHGNIGYSLHRLIEVFSDRFEDVNELQLKNVNGGRSAPPDARARMVC
ncbi:MAG: hypothetical protein ACUVS2_09950 [Candidatus Flexifilum sp.]|jgi:hypothetical protein